jgi:ribosomal protein L36
MKVKKAVRRLCEHCFVARRRGKLFIVCKKNPKHKQRQLFHTNAAAGSSTAAADLAAVRSSCDACHNRWTLLQSSSIYSSPIRCERCSARESFALLLYAVVATTSPDLKNIFLQGLTSTPAHSIDRRDVLVGQPTALTLDAAAVPAVSASL